MGNDYDPLAEFRRERWQKNDMDQGKEALTEHQALKLAIGALNEIPNTGLTGEYQSTYKLLPELEAASNKGTKDEQLRAAVLELLETVKASREMFYTLGDKDTQESKDCFALYEICDAALAKATPEPKAAEPQDVETEAASQQEAMNRKIAELSPRILDTLDLCEDALTNLGRMDDGTPSIQALINIQNIKKELASPVQPGVDKNPFTAKDSSVTAGLSERSVEREEGFEPER